MPAGFLETLSKEVIFIETKQSVEIVHSHDYNSCDIAGRRYLAEIKLQADAHGYTCRVHVQVPRLYK